MCVLVVQLCLILCDSMVCTQQGPLAIEFSRQEYWRGCLPFSRSSSWPRDQNRVSCISSMFFTIWATREAPIILEWVAIPFSRGSSQSRDPTQVSHTVSRFFTVWATREALSSYLGFLQMKVSWHLFLWILFFSTYANSTIMLHNLIKTFFF